jgi:hypothetical protein
VYGALSLGAMAEWGGPTLYLMRGPRPDTQT